MKHSLLFFLLFISSFAFGQNLVTYDFTGQPGNQGSTPPSFSAANMLASVISRGSGIAPVASSNTINSSGWSTGAIDLNNDYYELTLTPLGGFKLDLNDINFRERRSASGIRDFEIRTSLDGYATSYFSTNVPDNTSQRDQNFTFPAAFSNVTTSITIRIYGYNAEATGGTWHLRNNSITNDFSITGTVTSTSPPDIALTFDDTGDANIARGSNNNVIFRTFAQITTADATLNQVVLRTTGNYSSSDIKINGFKLWYSADNFLNAADTQIAATGSVSGNGETITFTGLSQALPTSSFNFLFVTVDVDANAIINNTIQIDNTTIVDFTFASPSNKTGTAASGNVHTIIGLTTGTVPTSLCITPTEGEPINVPFTYSPTGVYTGTTFTAQLSDASGSFLISTSIGSIVSDGSGNQTISATIPAATPQGSNYRIRVVSSVPDVEGADNGADIIINLLVVSISPTVTQNLTEFQNGDTITATESQPAQSRRWKYRKAPSTVYTEFLGSDISETPYFTEDGTYYMVVETDFECGKSSTSNEVQINVSNFVGTQLFPGDMAIIGWDANVGSGVDEFVLTNLVPLTQGTKFQVVNATYENGSVANVRDNEWQNTKIMEFTYKAVTDLAVGSIISFELPINISNPATNIRINNVTVPTTTLEGIRITGTESGGVNVSTGGADQIFVTQGSFKGIDFDGYILFGMTNGSNWIPLANDVSTLRTSRAHPNILCLNTRHTAIEDGSYYNIGALHAGSQREILSNIINMANWTDAVPIPVGVHTSTFTVTPNTIAQIEWIGGGSVTTNGDNWFLCTNWENFYVPNKRHDVIFTTSATDGARINADADYSDEYSDLAEVKNIILEEQILYINDARSSKLSIYEDLTIRNNGFLDMEDEIAFVEDGTINIRGNWINQIGTSAFEEGESLIVFEGGATQSITTAGGIESFYDLTINCTNDLTINNEVQLETSSDGLSSQGGRLTFVKGNIFSSAAFPNTYPVTFTYDADYDGASAKRHIRGASRRLSRSIEDFTFPIGKNGVYRPLTIHTTNNAIETQFFAEYFFDNYADLQPVITPLDHVSQIEYWILNRETPETTPNIADAQITLSWGIESEVGSLGSLVVAHWTDADQWESRGNSLTTGNITAGTVKSDDIITQFSPFTLGTINNLNLLPVTWLSFDAKYNQEQDNVLLEWATSVQYQNQSFTIERSENGIDFTEIGSEKGSLDTRSIKKYQFWDFEIIHSKVYYRIKQIDKNGKFTYSNTQTIDIEDNRKLGITNYQNKTILYANLNEATKAKIQIYDMNGNTIDIFEIALKEGRNEFIVPLKLSKAIYVYKIELENQSDFASGKFLVK
ncbi:T9SS type A sorting domain-containing protein [Bernardetia sp. Wsw4-3y2]|uniref:T9SS type A sorting domain-containing protein n=1 Tax=Bernardetia sp. Wsw4-3y2 TaxID=3127471 RepID=UPI0030D3A49E